MPPVRHHATRIRTAALTLFTSLCVALALAPLPGGAQTDSDRLPSAARTTGIINDSAKPKRPPVARRGPANVGVKFSSERGGRVTALQFYRSRKQNKAYVASLWDHDGTLLGRGKFRARDRAGWQRAKLREPVTLRAGHVYVASYLASHGNYVMKPRGFAKTRLAHGFTVPRHGGVIARGSKSVRPERSANGKNFLVDVVFTPTGATTPTTIPTTPPTTTPTGNWPAANNTGVPEGTALTTYNGPLTITAANTVIRNAIVNGTLEIEAPGVQIVNSRILGRVDLRDPRTTNASFSITDSEVHVGATLTTGIMRGNFTATRVEVTGGMRSIYCEYNCTVVDSWVHGQSGDPGGSTHFGGIRMGESTTLRHNTITCEAARGPGTGCSAGLTGYGDFGPIQNNLIEANLFLGGGGGGSTICAYGGSSGDDGSKPYGDQANNVRFINNVFARGASGTCGNIRAVSGFDPDRPGNVWSGNTWDDGTTLSHTD